MTVLRGESVSPGIAVGPVHLRGYDEDDVAGLRIAADQVEDELNRLRAALQKSRGQIEEIKQKQSGQLGEAEMRTPGGGRLDRYVETDRAIPRGFAGGPLVDVDGRGLGLSTRSVFRGADLAVPAPTLRRVVGAILAHGSVARGFLGVSAYPVRLPRHLAGQRGQDRGALVVAVDDGSPAESAGLFVGDVLVSIAGEAVDGPHTLRDALVDRAGATVAIEVARAGALTTLSATIGRRTG